MVFKCKVWGVGIGCIDGVLGRRFLEFWCFRGCFFERLYLFNCLYFLSFKFVRF